MSRTGEGYSSSSSRALLIALLALVLVGCAQKGPQISSSWTGDSEQIAGFYQSWRGTPYRLGGSSRTGIDCSAFVQALYSDVYGYRLPRTTEDQAELGRSVDGMTLRPGDLVFFKTGWKVRHVGVYLGQGEFVHASTSIGVTRSRLDNPYWQDAYWMTRRIF